MRDLLLEIRRGLLLANLFVRFGLVPLVRLLLGLPPLGPHYPSRLRQAIEKLGLTYLKLGQYLAVRYDIVPLEVAHELNRLFNAVPPMPPEEAMTVLESELRQPFSRLFASLAPSPIAAASVAQVHEGRLLDGRRVAVKIQRRGIGRIFTADIRNLRRLARIVDLLGLAGNVSVREFLDEFAAYTWRELDFVNEGRTAERVRQRATPNEVVPQVYWPYTTSKVLTLEFIEGTSMARIIATFETGGMELVRKTFPQLDIDRAVRHLLEASFRQFYVTGLFHADPHPGNILVLNDNRVAFVDFGITGELTDYLRDILLNYIENLGLGQVDSAYRYLARLFIPSPDTDPRAFEQAIKPILTRWVQASRHPESVPAQARLASRVADETLLVIRQHRMRMSLDVLLYWRAITVLDSTVLRASPKFDYLRVLNAFFEKIRPGFEERILDLLGNPRRALALAELLRRLPGQTSGILHSLAEDRLQSAAAAQESHQVSSKEAANSRLLTAALLTTLLAILVATGPAEPGLRVPMLVGGSLVLGWALRRGKVV